MATYAHPLQRLVSRKTFFKGMQLRCLLWSTAGSLLLCLLLIEVWLVAGLLVDRGQLELTAEEFAALDELVPNQELAAGEAEGPKLNLSNRGILPAVWQGRNCICARSLGPIYGAIDALQSNSSALTLLSLSIILTGAFCGIAFSQARMNALRESVALTTAQRQAVHRQTLRLAPAELQDNHNGELQRMFSSDMDDLQLGLYHWLLRWAREPVKLGLLVILAIATGPLVAGLVLLLLLGCWILIAWQKQLGRAQRALGKSRSEDKLRLLAETLSTTRLVRGYGKEMETFEGEQFQQHLKQHANDTVIWMGQDWFHRWGLMSLAALTGGILIFFVGHQILDPESTFTLPSAVLLVATVACMHYPLRNLWNLRSDVKQGGHVATRIETYLGLSPSVGQAVGAKFLQPMSKSLVFDNVAYANNGHEKLLDGCSLRIKAGSSVAVVSTTPWEARAVAHLLPRFIEPQSGQILIDGEDIAWVTLESLRAEVILVSARDPFFTGSVLQNLRCGDDHYSLQEVTDAAEMTHAHNFIQKLPQGYETVIGEHGEQLDAGQSFRLGLARAVLRDPALMIIEEPAETIDEGTKSLLDDAYQRICQKRTVIFLPHRMATIRRADEIIVIHKGKVVAMGNHTALLKSSPIYAHWEYLNFNTFRHEMALTE